MWTEEQLQKMSQFRLNTVNRAGLADFCNIEISRDLAPEQLEPPYYFLWGDIVVNVRFSLTGEVLENKLRNFFISLKKM